MLAGNTGGMAREVRVLVMGPITVRAGGRSVPIGGPRPQRLVLALALAVGSPLSRDSLVDAIWGDDVPTDPARDLRVMLSRLRKTLGVDVIRTHNDVVLISAEDDCTDILEHDRLLREARALSSTGQFAGAASRFEAAEELWRGPIGQPFDDLAMCRIEASRLEVARSSAQIEHLQALLASGRSAEAAARSAALIETSPYTEALWEVSIRALYHQGRQADALATYRRLEQTLLDDMGLDPSPPMQALELAVLNHDPTLVPGSIPLRRSTTSAATAPLGRVGDLSAVHLLLHPGTTTSIVGLGGVGKTTLAETVVADRRRSGVPVLTIDFTVLDEGADVLPTVAEVVGAEGDLTPEELAQSIRPDTLVLLDNCEHVITGAAALAGHLNRTRPDVSCLTTTRRPLAIDTERIHRLSGLVVPDPSAVTSGLDLMLHPATRLFVETCREPPETISTEDAQAIVAACSALDGLPLAILLAAGLVSALSFDGLRRRLDDLGLAVLRSDRPSVPRRHRLLTDVIEASVGILNEVERTVLVVLAAAPGSTQLSMVESILAAVGADPAALPVAISGVLDRALAVRRTDIQGEPRFQVLSTVRKHLERNGWITNEWRVIWAKHVIAWVEEATARGSAEIDDADLLRTLDMERANMDRAVDVVIAAQDAGYVEAAAVSLWAYWMKRPGLRVALDRLRRARGLVAKHGTPDFALLTACMIFEASVGDIDEAADIAGECIAVARASADPGMLVRALGNASNVQRRRGDWLEMDALRADMLRQYQSDPDHPELSRRAGDIFALAASRALGRAELDDAERFARRSIEFGYTPALDVIAEVTAARGDMEGALAVLVRASDERETLDLQQRCANYGQILEWALYNGDVSMATEYATLLRDTAAPDGVVAVLPGAAAPLARYLATSGRTEEAQRLIGEAVDRVETHEGLVELLEAAAHVHAEFDVTVAAQCSEWAVHLRHLRPHPGVPPATTHAELLAQRLGVGWGPSGTEESCPAGTARIRSEARALLSNARRPSRL